MKKNQVHIIWGIAVVIALIGGFFVGKAMAAPSRGGFAGAGNFGSSTRTFARGGGVGGGFATGMITAMDSQSITLQLPNGNSQVVFYSSSTSVTEPTDVSISTLKTGTNVMIGGTSNSDGSLTATSIQVRNGMMTGPGGRNASTTSAQ